MKRVLIGLGVLVLLYGVYSVGRGYVITWYADTRMPRQTRTVADENPSQVCLTFGADPRTTLAAQWRTATSVTEALVQVKEGADGAVVEFPAKRETISDPMLKNDPENARWSAVMSGLKPGTKYQYRAGSKAGDHWTPWTDLTTAPEGAQPYSFVYMGDPQLGLDYWGKLLHACHAKFPNAAFDVIAGDLVDRGKYRDDWDTFFEAADGIFNRYPIVPVLGNHDYSSKPVPEMYLKIFTLPENGPKELPKEYAYSYRYGNTLFVILDANQDPKTQAPWLEETLKNTDATWKIASFHQPAYASKSTRDNPEIREVWGALFDKYHVDVAIQGHDHAYLRTPPMRAGKKAASFAEGTVYIISVSGTKYYDQDPHDYAEVQFANTSTYQILDIGTTPKNTLTYHAYDLEGTVKDEFHIEK